MNTYKPLAWAGTAALGVAALFLLVATNHQLNSATTTNTVSFDGEGKVLSKPDIATVDLSITTQAITAKAAQDSNNKKSKAVIDFLKNQKIDEKDIKSQAYNIYPQISYQPYGGNPTTTGYQVNESIQIKIRNLDDLDPILGGVITAGANQVNNVQLTVDDPQKLKDQAREEAIKNAKEKAKALENQLGVHLGHIVGFQESGNYPGPIFYDKAQSNTGIGGGGPTIPTTGENEITTNVTITYQIK